MLSPMTGVALSHSHATPPFNSTFYATIATVIPVLFLAIGVQGTLYGDTVKLSYAFSAKFKQAVLRRSASAAARYNVARRWTGFVAIAIAWYSIAGEIDAILSLENQRPYGMPGTPTAGAIALTLALAVNPVLAFRQARRSVNQTHADPAAADAAPSRRERAPRTALKPVTPAKTRPLPKWANRKPIRTKPSAHRRMR